MENNIHYDIATIIISAILIFYFANKTKKSDSQNRLFLALMIVNAFTAIADVVNNYAEKLHWPIWTDYACSTVYFVTHIMIIPIFLFYTLSDAKEWYAIPGWFKALTVLPIVLAEVIVLINPFTKWIYEYNSDGTYVRNGGITIMYAVTAFYMICLFTILLTYRVHYSFTRRIVTFATVLIILLAMGIQFMFVNVRLETFACVIDEMLLFYFVQNPRSQVDYESRLFNSITFKNVLTQKIAKKTYLDVIAVVVTNFDDNKKRNIVDDENSIITGMADFFRGLEDVDTYRYAKNVFCLEANLPTDEDVDDIVELIKQRFEEPWQCGRYELMYNIKMCHVRLPEDIDSIDKLTGIIEEVSHDKSGKRLFTIDDFDINNLERRTKISDALAKAIDADSFELVFSSIYSVQDGKIVAAECSSRFLDSELGYVNEREFIEYNDRSGLMVPLGKTLFEKACAFIAENDLEEMGISFITINLAAESCLKYDLVNSISEIFDEYNIDPKLICFQISEYMVSRMDESINDIMNALTQKGFRLCLNNYGSGYTNLASIYELPLDVIKLEKNVVRSANKNAKAQITLESTLDLAKNLNMQTMIDGISEENEFEMLSRFPCDYAVGAFFFHDMDVATFVENVQMHKTQLQGGAAK